MAENLADAISLCAKGACVIVFLLDQAATDSKLREGGVGAALNDKVLVNLTQGTPDEARVTHKLLKSVTGNIKPQFLDGAISGHNTAALVGEGAVWVSGDDVKTFRDVKPVLLEMGRALFVGRIGASKALNYGVSDLLIHCLFSVLANAWMLEEEGVDMDIFYEEAAMKLNMPAKYFKELVPQMKARKRSGNYTSDPFFTLDVLQAYFKPRQEYEASHGKTFLFNEFCLQMSEEAMGGSPNYPYRSACITRIQEVMQHQPTQHTAHTSMVGGLAIALALGIGIGFGVGFAKTLGRK